MKTGDLINAPRSQPDGAHIHLRGTVVPTFTDPIVLLAMICAAYVALNLLAALFPMLLDRTALPPVPACSSDFWIDAGTGSPRRISPVARGAAWGGGASPRPTALAGGGGLALPTPAAPVFGEMEYSLHTTPPFLFIGGGGVVWNRPISDAIYTYMHSSRDNRKRSSALSAAAENPRTVFPTEQQPSTKAQGDGMDTSHPSAVSRTVSPQPPHPTRPAKGAERRAQEAVSGSSVSA